MIRFLTVMLVAVAALAFSASSAVAAEEVTLEGKVLCGKCELKESPKCAVAIVVEKDGKKSTYWFDTASSKKYHGDVCQTVKPATIKGTVAKEGDKMIVSVTELKYK